MRKEELLKTMFHSFFLIVTGVVASMYVFCLAFPADALFSPDVFGIILLTALACELPLLIFYSRGELDKKQMRTRTVIHFFALLAILLGLSQLWDWVDFKKPGEIAVFIALVLCVYVAVEWITVYREKKLADQLNQRLRQRYPS